MRIDHDDCQTCALRFHCNNNRKSPGYKCDSYAKDIDVNFADIFNTDFDALDNIQQNEEKAKYERYQEDSIDFEKFMDKVEGYEIEGQDLAAMFPSNDMPEAANFYEFMVDKRFMGERPYAKQLFIGLELFGEYCPDCSHRVDMLKTREGHCNIEEGVPVDYNIDNVPGDFVLLRNGICPRCQKTKPQLIMEGKLKLYSELACCAGQRSGKTQLQGWMMAYYAHKIIMMGNPAAVFDQAADAKLTGTLVSITAFKAAENLYQSLKTILISKPWFIQYHKLLRSQERENSLEVHKINETKLIYTHRSFRVLPNGPNMGSLRGDTRVFGVIDEIGIFDENKKIGDASEVYTSINTSLLTIRKKVRKLMARGDVPNLLNAYGIYISSPLQRDDMIMELVNKGREKEDTVAIHAPTWEMNPDYKDGPDKDPELISMKISMGPEKFDRDIGCNPPYADSAYIKDPQKYALLFVNRNELGNYKYVDTIHGRYAVFNEKLIGSDTPSVLGLDAGRNKNSFAICLARINFETGRPEVIGLMEIAPDFNQRIAVNATELLDKTIMPIIRAYNVVRLYTDTWESDKIITDVHKWTYDNKLGRSSCTGKQYSLRHAVPSDFDLVKSSIQDLYSFTTFPYLEGDMNAEEVLETNWKDVPHCFQYTPMRHFLFQLATVREMPKTIEKGMGRNYTDDLFRAVWIALRHLYHPEEVQHIMSRKGDFLTKRHTNYDGKKTVIAKKSKKSFSPLDYKSYTKKSTVISAMGKRSVKGNSRILMPGGTERVDPAKNFKNLEIKPLNNINPYL